MKLTKAWWITAVLAGIGLVVLLFNYDKDLTTLSTFLSGWVATMAFVLLVANMLQQGAIIERQEEIKKTELAEAQFDETIRELSMFIRQLSGRLGVRAGLNPNGSFEEHFDSKVDGRFMIEELARYLRTIFERQNLDAKVQTGLHLDYPDTIERLRADLDATISLADETLRLSAETGIARREKAKRLQLDLISEKLSIIRGWPPMNLKPRPAA